MLYYVCELNSQQKKGVYGVADKIAIEKIMIEKNISKRQLAKYLNITEQGLYKKLNNITEFKASEIAKLANLFGVDKGNDIFFKIIVN